MPLNIRKESVSQLAETLAARMAPQTRQHSPHSPITAKQEVTRLNRT